jgi:hypothetical protein
MTQFSIEEMGGRDGTKALFSAQMALQWNGAAGPKLVQWIGIMLHAETCRRLVRSEYVSL